MVCLFFKKTETDEERDAQAEKFKNILTTDDSAQVFIFSLLHLFHELYNYLSF